MPKPWHCNLLNGGSRECPPRGGVHIIGSCEVVECDLLTRPKYRRNFRKHLQVQYTPGNFYLSLQNIVLHSSPIACSVPPRGRPNKLIAMKSVTIASRRGKSSATEKPANKKTAKRKMGRPPKSQAPLSPDAQLQKAKMKLLPPAKPERGRWKRKRVAEQKKKKRKVIIFVVI